MIRTIAVIGAGTMGHGIAEFFAMKGYPVNVYESCEPIRSTVKKTIEDELTFLAENDMIGKAEIDETINRIKIYDDLKVAVQDVDYVIEATPENLELKRVLFRELNAYCKEETILASNTSSLPLFKMIQDLPEERKQRSMVCHWYNPAHLMPLVELSFFGNMTKDIYEEVAELYKKAGKQTAKVLKDVPGLVANRIQQGVAREVFSLMEEEIALPEDIDTALKFGPAFRYATTGQLEVADMGGLDIWCTVGDNLLKVMDNRREANPILREKVLAGKLGMKTGEGFFEYPEETVAEKKDAFNRKLIIQLKASENYID